MNGAELARVNYQAVEGGFAARLEIHWNPAHLACSIISGEKKPVTPYVYTLISKHGLVSDANEAVEPYVFGTLAECFAAGEKVKVLWEQTDEEIREPDGTPEDYIDNNQSGPFSYSETEEAEAPTLLSQRFRKLITSFSDLSIISAFVYAIAGLWNTPPFDYRQTPHASLFLAINCFAVVMIVFYAFLRGWSCANPDCDGIFPKTAP